MVYVVQAAAGRNLMPARKFGNLVELLPFNFNTHSDCRHILPKLKDELKAFSDEDYLLPIGNPVAIGLCTVLAAEANEGKVRFLVWDREAEDYYTVNMDAR